MSPTWMAGLLYSIAYVGAVVLIVIGIFVWFDRRERRKKPRGGRHGG